MAGVRGAGGRLWGEGDRPVSRLRRASKSRGAGRVEGVTCGKLAWGYVETGQEGRWNRAEKQFTKCQNSPCGRWGGPELPTGFGDGELGAAGDSLFWGSADWPWVGARREGQEAATLLSGSQLRWRPVLFAECAGQNSQRQWVDDLDRQH